MQNGRGNVSVLKVRARCSVLAILAKECTACACGQHVFWAVQLEVQAPSAACFFLKHHLVLFKIRVSARNEEASISQAVVAR